YISVLERTKEIGVLRSMGASKRNISNIFTAETLIIGLISGLIGVGLTILLNMPINAILDLLLTDVTITASLPMGAGIILVAISMILTFIAGLIPSKMAAKKDPVVALRTE
ncbi:MAG: FtsX-like permease family protein, partial [Ruminococcus sp.]|nr:FtsX-like permease family protein [Ruminococcus sp.]